MSPTYTGKGDAGETSLTGARVMKDHLRVEALGAVDELNAALGVAMAHVTSAGRRRTLEEVQNVLFTLGAELSASGGEAPKADLPRIEEDHVGSLEAAIEGLRVAPLESFVLPRGSEAAAQLHLARAVARRAERRVVALAGAPGEVVRPPVLQYLNRLSTLLFTMALRENEAAGVEERPPTYGG